MTEVTIVSVGFSSADSRYYISSRVDVDLRGFSVYNPIQFLSKGKCEKSTKLRSLVRGSLLELN